jgi:hypothetical protein
MPCRREQTYRREDGNSMTGSKISRTSGSTISNHNQPSQAANFKPTQKHCFNKGCAHKGTRWVGIIGRLADFNGLVVPYYLCEECYLLFKNNPFMLFRRQNAEPNSIQKMCYIKHCDNNGVHWIKIVNASIAQAGYEVWYCICNECYAFLEGIRKEVYDVRNCEEGTLIIGKEAVSTEDLCHLLESSRFKDERKGETTPECDREESYCNKIGTGSQNELSVKSGSKICFNPCCNNKGENWLTIVGRYAGYSDYEVQYCVCNKCNSFLDFRRQHLNDLINKLQGMGEVYQIGANIAAHDPFSGKLTVTTKDLDNLTTDTQAYGMTESEESKVCYNLYCNNEGTHWISIINATTLLKDHEIPYCVCDECYAFFNYRRKDPLVFPSLKALFDDSLTNERNEEKVSGISPFTGKEVITTKDLHSLLESTQSPQEQSSAI